MLISVPQTLEPLSWQVAIFILFARVDKSHMYPRLIVFGTLFIYMYFIYTDTHTLIHTRNFQTKFCTRFDQTRSIYSTYDCLKWIPMNCTPNCKQSYFTYTCVWFVLCYVVFIWIHLKYFSLNHILSSTSICGFD